MSNITELLGTGNVGVDRSTINDNFDSLNSGKVETESGKGLSTNDYDNTAKATVDATSGTNTGDQDLSGKQNILSEGAFVDGDKTKLDNQSGTNTGDQDISGIGTNATDILSLQIDKVDKVAGKGLSTNDYDDSAKLTVSDTSGVNTGDQDVSGKQDILAEGAFVDGDKTKLDGIETSAEVNNISDVNATDLTDSGESTLHHHASDRSRANHTGTQAASTITSLPVEIGIAASDESTDLETGIAKLTFRTPYAMTLTGVRASVNTAPTGSSLVVDVNEGGVSVLSTKLSIDATEKTSTTATTPPVISDSSIADDAEMTIDIDQIGSTIAGTGLKIWLIGTRS